MKKKTNNEELLKKYLEDQYENIKKQKFSALAAIFTVPYLLYKKLWIEAIIYFIMSYLIFICMYSMISNSFVTLLPVLILKIGMGFLTNYLYLCKMSRMIKKIESSVSSEKQKEFEKKQKNSLHIFSITCLVYIFVFVYSLGILSDVLKRIDETKGSAVRNVNYVKMLPKAHDVGKYMSVQCQGKIKGTEVKPGEEIECIIRIDNSFVNNYDRKLDREGYLEYLYLTYKDTDYLSVHSARMANIVGLEKKDYYELTIGNNKILIDNKDIRAWNELDRNYIDKNHFYKNNRPCIEDTGYYNKKVCEDSLEDLILYVTLKAHQKIEKGYNVDNFESLYTYSCKYSKNSTKCHNDKTTKLQEKIMFEESTDDTTKEQDNKENKNQTKTIDTSNYTSDFSEQLTHFIQINLNSNDNNIFEKASERMYYINLMFPKKITNDEPIQPSVAYVDYEDFIAKYKEIFGDNYNPDKDIEETGAAKLCLNHPSIANQNKVCFQINGGTTGPIDIKKENQYEIDNQIIVEAKYTTYNNNKKITGKITITYTKNGDNKYLKSLVIKND